MRASILLAAAALLCIANTQAGVRAKALQIEDAAKAPFLAVCTVRDVIARELVADKTTGWNGAGRYFEAKLRVERVFRGSAETVSLPQPNETITLRYVSYDPDGMCCVNGRPQFPRLKAGDIALFPMKPAAQNGWNLMTDEAYNIITPAIHDAWRTPVAPESPRAFILHELANTFARGTYVEESVAARYLAEEEAEPAELRGMLETIVGGNDDKWLEVATALLGFTGAPQVSISDLRKGSPIPGFPNKSIPAIARWALEKGVMRDYPNRLVAALIARGLGERLREFSTLPVLDLEMVRALGRRAPDSLRLAFNFVRSGHATFLREALEAGLGIAREPRSVPAENRSALTFACELIIGYGSEAQFEELAGLLRGFQATDEDQYRTLWGAIDGSENKRALRLAAIVITDRRIMSRDVRYCDTAVGEVSRISGEQFWAGVGSSVADRDAGIARAVGWLRSNGVI